MVTTHQRNGERYTDINIPERLLEAAKECDITDECVSDLVRNNAALHDATVSKDQYRHLNLKKYQWVFLEQLTKVLEPLQMANTIFVCGVNTSSSIIYPVQHRLIRNHIKSNDKDVYTCCKAFSNIRYPKI